MFLNLLPISSIQKLNDCEDMLNNDNTSIKDKLVCSYRYCNLKFKKN